MTKTQCTKTTRRKNIDKQYTYISTWVYKEHTYTLTWICSKHYLIAKLDKVFQAELNKTTDHKTVNMSWETDGECSKSFINSIPPTSINRCLSSNFVLLFQRFYIVHFWTVSFDFHQYITSFIPKHQAVIILFSIVYR